MYNKYNMSTMNGVEHKLQIRFPILLLNHRCWFDELCTIDKILGAGYFSNKNTKVLSYIF